MEGRGREAERRETGDEAGLKLKDGPGRGRRGHIEVGVVPGVKARSVVAGSISARSSFLCCASDSSRRASAAEIDAFATHAFFLFSGARPPPLRPGGGSDPASHLPSSPFDHQLDFFVCGLVVPLASPRQSAPISAPEGQQYGGGSTTRSTTRAIGLFSGHRWPQPANTLHGVPLWRNMSLTDRLEVSSEASSPPCWGRSLTGRLSLCSDRFVPPQPRHTTQPNRSQCSHLYARILPSPTCGQADLSRTVQHHDPWFWSRIKAAVEQQTFQSLLNNTQGADEAWNGAMSRWIWPAINARVPPPAVTVDSTAMEDEDDNGGGLGFESKLDSKAFFLPDPLPAHSRSDTAYAPPPQRPPQSPPFGADSAYPPTTYPAPNPNPVSATYFPNIVIPASASPFYDSAPLTSLDPQLLTYSSPPAVPPILTSFPTLPTITTTDYNASPFPNGNVLVQTAYATWNEATSPGNPTSPLYGSEALFGTFDMGGGGGFLTSNEYRPAGSGNDVYSTSEETTSDPPRSTPPLPPPTASSFVEPPPLQGRSRSFGSGGQSSGGRGHRHTLSGSSRVEPYPTSALDASDIEDSTSSRAGHRRGSSASQRVPSRSPENKPLDHFRIPKSEDSPSTGFEQLHLSPNPPSLFPPAPSSSTMTSTTTSRPRAKSDASVKRREKRKLNITSDAVFRDNDSSVFVIYAPAKEDKVHITPNDLHEVVLDSHLNQPGTSLFNVAFNHVPYTPELRAADCSRSQSYIFTSTNPKKPGQFHVSFSFAHAGGVVQVVNPNDGVTLREARLPMTFIHFPPNSIVVFPAHPIGSANWWRLPRCVGRHLKPDEPDGSWTG